MKLNLRLSDNLLQLFQLVMVIGLPLVGARIAWRYCMEMGAAHASPATDWNYAAGFALFLACAMGGFLGLCSGLLISGVVLRIAWMLQRRKWHERSRGLLKSGAYPSRKEAQLIEITQGAVWGEMQPVEGARYEVQKDSSGWSVRVWRVHSYDQAGKPTFEQEESTTVFLDKRRRVTSISTGT